MAVFTDVHLDAAEAAYIQELKHFVQHRLRMNEDGQPAAWVLLAVHADVCGLENSLAWLRARPQVFPRGEESGNSAGAVQIQLEVVDDGEYSVTTKIALPSPRTLGHRGPGKFDLGRDWSDPDSTRVIDQASAYVPGNGLKLKSADWKHLRQMSIEAVDAAIEALKQIHAIQTRDYVRRRSDFKAGVVEDYAPALVDWLWGRNGEVIRGRHRNQVYDILDALGLDSPFTNPTRETPSQS